MNLGANQHPLWARVPQVEHEFIDVYETELHRFLDGKVPEKLFLEFRLRHGTYGQRQPGTQMQRIKIPLGRLTADKMERLADLAEEYSDRIIHITTRQDVQLHFVNILDTPDIFRRLADVGITTKEACGNTVRNVTGCPISGVCATETFDVTPHAQAMSRFLLKHPDAQNFGRKFKISFSGCEGEACALAGIHDIGAVATVRTADGAREEGFRVYVGGGLGAVPQKAQLFAEFVRLEEMLPLAQAIARVFARLGEKRQRARARMKFLVANLGIDEFRRLVLEEREKLPDDPERDAIYREAVSQEERPLREPSELDLSDPSLPADFRIWHRRNVRAQRQPGYSIVTVSLPLGDVTSAQFRGLAIASRKYVRDTVRLTVPQNVVLRWVSNADLPALFEDLRKLELDLPLADSIADLTACPGTDTCKLGIASSRGLAGVLHEHFLREFREDVAKGGDGNLVLRDDIVVKMSGCFNSCAQHHIANIGFFGTSKRKGGHVMPLFQVILGGETKGNASSYGLPVTKVPAHRAPEVVRRLTKIYDENKLEHETFNDVMARLGKKDIADRLADLAELGDDEVFLHDNRQPWRYVKEVGQGECAGEIVDQAEFLLEDAERLIFQASLELEKGDYESASRSSVEAMKMAADALLSTNGLLLSDNYDTRAKFEELWVETGKFFPGVAEYYAKAASEGDDPVGADRSRQRVEESNLFVVQAQEVYGRLAGKQIK